MRRRKATDTELWCGGCKTMHPRAAFGKDRNTPEGLAYACKAVVSERNHDNHSRNREKRNADHAARRVMRKNSKDSRQWALKKLIYDASRRAKDRGLEFSLNLSHFVEVPEICPILGFTLVYQANGKRLPESASLDRINSANGYTPDNVWIISWRANQIKNDANLVEIKALYDALCKKSAGRLLDGVQHDGYPDVKP